jgi:hypothetical protein
MARDFTTNRSKSYQHLIVESLCAPELLTEFSDFQSIGGLLNHHNYNEELYELYEQLRQAYWKIIYTQLTPRQKQVLRLCADGYTQIEIAKKLNVNQSSVTKSINGNCDYRNGRRVYGGSRRKLRKIAAKDIEIQAILHRIAEIQDD